MLDGFSDSVEIHLHYSLELQALDVLKIVRLGITASVDTRNNDAEVVGSITF